MSNETKTVDMGAWLAEQTKEAVNPVAPVTAKKADKRELGIKAAATKAKDAVKATLVGADSADIVGPAVLAGAMVVALEQGAGSWRGAGLKTLYARATDVLGQVVKMAGVDLDDATVSGMMDLPVSHWDEAVTPYLEDAGLVRMESAKGFVYFTEPKVVTVVPFSW